MKYFVKYLLKNQYNLADKLTIKSGEEAEVDKEVFDYLNSTYGDAGMFTFRKEATKEVAKEAEPVKPSRRKKKETVEAKEDEVVETSEK